MPRISAVVVKASMSEISASGQNYFELFGLTPMFALDRQRLEQHYRDMQQRIHPDRHAQSSDNERRLAAQWTSLANEGFQTLKHPLRRAQYLLQLQQISASPAALPGSFLLEQMEWRESLANAKTRRDEHALNQLHFTVQQQLATLEQQLSDLFDKQADYTRAAGLVMQGQFLEKLANEINTAIDELLDAAS